MSKKVGARKQLSMLDFSTATKRPNDTTSSTTSIEPPKKISPQNHSSGTSAAAEPKSSHGRWDSIDNALLVYTSSGVEARSKVAGFDMDGTLIKTKSGNVFPRYPDDWQLWSSKIPAKLKKLHDDGYKIVIFTNQRGIETGKVNVPQFKNKIVNVIKALRVPAQAFVSTGPVSYRKPHVGMWLEMERTYNDNVPVDRTNSLYCGDAAGRIKIGARKADHSCADRSFALNLGVEFLTPEQLFLDQPHEEPYKISGFRPTDYFSTKKERFDPADTEFPYDEFKNEVIIMVGPQASGKSHLAKSLADEYDYAIVNQDTLGNKKECERLTQKYLSEGKNVIIDNTNRNPDTRSAYIRMARGRGYRVRAIVMNCDLDMALHNNTFRKIMNTGSNAKAHSNINTMVIRQFFNAYVSPTIGEGFDDIIYCNFVPDFPDEDARRVYNYILNEK